MLPIFHLLDPLTLQVLRRLDPRLGRAAVDLLDQDLVVELVDLQGDIILHLLRALPGRLQLGLRNIVLRRLIFSSVVSGWVSWVPLVVKSRPPWLMTAVVGTRAARDCPKTTRIDLYQLRIGQMHEVAFISNAGKIFAFHRLLGLLLLLDLVFGDADQVVVLKRQLDGLMQSDLSGGAVLPGSRRRRERRRRPGPARGCILLFIISPP